MNLLKLPRAIKQRVELEKMLRPFVLAIRQRDKANSTLKEFKSATKHLKNKEEEQARETALSPHELTKPATNREKLEALLNVRHLIEEIETPSKAQLDMLALVNSKIEIIANRLDRQREQRNEDWLKDVDIVIAKWKRENRKSEKYLQKVLQREKTAKKVFEPSKNPLDKVLQEKMTLMETNLADTEKDALKAKDELKALLSHASSSLAKETVADSANDIKVVIAAVQELRRLLDLTDPETNRISQEIDELLLVLNQRYQEMLSPQSREREARQAKASLKQLINPLESDYVKPYIPEDIEELSVLIKYGKDLRDALDKNDKDYADLKWKTDCRISAWEFTLKNLLEQDQNA